MGKWRVCAPKKKKRLITRTDEPSHNPRNLSYFPAFSRQTSGLVRTKAKDLRFFFFCKKRAKPAKGSEFTTRKRVVQFLKAYLKKQEAANCRTQEADLCLFWKKSQKAKKATMKSQVALVVVLALALQHQCRPTSGYHQSHIF